MSAAFTDARVSVGFSIITGARRDDDRINSTARFSDGILRPRAAKGQKKGQRGSTRDQRRAKVVEFPKGIGSSGWIRTSNPPVNRSGPEDRSGAMDDDEGDETQ